MNVIPRPLSIVVVGTVGGIALFVLGVVDEERVEPIYPLVLVNLAAVTLAMLLTKEKCRRAAAGATLTIAIWFGLYAATCALAWRSVALHIDEERREHAESPAFRERQLVKWHPRVEPNLGALVLRDFEETIRTERADHESFLGDARRREATWRSELFLCLAVALACGLGAARRLECHLL